MCILLNVKKHEKTFALNVDIFTNEKTTEKCLTGFFCCAIVKNAILWQDMPTMLSKQGWLML